MKLIIKLFEIIISWKIERSILDEWIISRLNDFGFRESQELADFTTNSHLTADDGMS